MQKVLITGEAGFIGTEIVKQLWLLADKLAPRKQRHTAKRVFKCLKDEADGFDCSYRLVALYVKQKKRNCG